MPKVNSALRQEGCEWKPGVNFSWLYVALSGRIIGEVGSSMRQTYLASCRGKSLGEFYTERQAKAAVENAAAQPETLCANHPEERDDEPNEPQDYGCRLPPGECCMPGLHFPSECHTAEAYERSGR